MAMNKGDIPFIGTRDGICGYWWHGFNIIRKSTPLTGTRVKKDPAFKGFRKSSNRMKEASPIAAALYNQIPGEQKKYSLYRLLTGEALKMFKDNPTVRYPGSTSFRTESYRSMIKSRSSPIFTGLNVDLVAYE
jgi:hypothetical protein